MFYVSLLSSNNSFDNQPCLGTILVKNHPSKPLKSHDAILTKKNEHNEKKNKKTSSTTNLSRKQIITSKKKIEKLRMITPKKKIEKDRKVMKKFLESRVCPPWASRPTSTVPRVPHFQPPRGFQPHPMPWMARQHLQIAS